MDRYQAKFSELNKKNQGAFVPFVTIGDPNPEQSFAVINALVEGGADALELGIPFSDPLADGPTIQDATLRALHSGTTPDVCFNIIRRIRDKYPDLPIGLLMYANIIYHAGLDNFYARAKKAGVDSILIADVPTIEAAPFITAAKAHGVLPIFIAPPNADDQTLKAVAELGGGYTYLLSRAGVTGAEKAAHMPVHKIIDKLKTFQAPPPLLGFGISKKEQVSEAIHSGAAGAISGSAVVNIIQSHLDDNEAMLTNLKAFVADLKSGTTY